MRQETNAKGLTPEEVQEAIEHAKVAKTKTFDQFLKETQSMIIELASLNPLFAKGIIEGIKKHYPDLIKDI